MAQLRSAAKGAFAKSLNQTIRRSFSSQQSVEGRPPCIGILAEVKNKWERRAPLTPTHVKELIDQSKADTIQPLPSLNSEINPSLPLEVLIQPSPKRIFTDGEYTQAGAKLSANFNEYPGIKPNILIGVKEFPYQSLIENMPYLIFSHTIKAQPVNMRFLDECTTKNVRLFDYECIREAPTATQSNSSGPRLVAFGEFAGIAGMIDGLRGLGERFLSLGYSTPFLSISSSYMYPSIASAHKAIQHVADEIKRIGLPPVAVPFTMVFTGNGNVTKGALSVFTLLPHKFVDPSELPHLKHDPNVIYACQLEAKHMARRKAEFGSQTTFDKAHYYAHPQEYEPIFHENIAPYTSMLVNGMYWDPRFPPLLTIEQHRQLQLQSMNQSNQPSLRTLLAIADITCDIDGSVQMTNRSTTIDDPFFVANSLQASDVPAGAQSGKSAGKVDGPGTLILAVDNLPAEWPRDASEHFSQALKPFIPALARLDSTKPLDLNQTNKQAVNYLPPELANALITDANSLTPNFKYIEKLRKANESIAHPPVAVAQSATPVVAVSDMTRTYLLSGHLFDTNFINAALDVFEDLSTDFRVLFWNVTPNRINQTTNQANNNRSECVIEVEWPDKQSMSEAKARLDALARAISKAEAAISELTYNQSINPALQQSVSQATLNVKAAGQVQQARSYSTRASSFAQGGQKRSFSTRSSPKETLKSTDILSGASPKRVLVLGSGYVAGPLVDWLGRQGHELIVGSNLINEARCLIDHLPSGKAIEVNASDPQSINQAVKGVDLVISLLPASMHMPVARACLEHRVHLVTASYVSPEMQAINDQAAEHGLIFLNELGLDPGLDHLTAMAAFDAAKERGARATHFTSVCGGLPAPDVADNPFAYKFSWSPAGMLIAATRPARFQRGSKVIEVPGPEVLNTSQPFLSINRALALEHYPNRDSLNYLPVYSLDGSKMDTMYRGTLRYQGTPQLMRMCGMLGLVDQTPLQTPASNWRSLMSTLVNNENVESGIEKKLRAAGVSADEAIRARDALVWLGATSRDQQVSAKQTTPFDAFCSLLQSKLTFQPAERDCVVLAHDFKFAESDGSHTRFQSTLIAYGGEGKRPTAIKAGGGSGLHGFSAMARTVGLPAAMGAQLILNKQISQKGVLIPTSKEIYQPILQELEKEGIRFVDTETKL